MSRGTVIVTDTLGMEHLLEPARQEAKQMELPGISPGFAYSIHAVPLERAKELVEDSWIASRVQDAEMAGRIAQELDIRLEAAPGFYPRLERDDVMLFVSGEGDELCWYYVVMLGLATLRTYGEDKPISGRIEA